MKKYRLSEELGNIDEEFLEEVLEYKKSERKITVSKKKFVSIMVAAAVVMALGVTTVAAAGGELDVLRNFFNGRGLSTSKNESEANLPVIEDIGDIEGVPNSDEDNSPDERFRLVSSLCDKYSFFGTVEFDATGIELPELTNGEKFLLWNVTANQPFGPYADTTFVSREGDILTFIFRITDGGEIPESFTFSIGSLGYCTTGAQFYRYSIKEDLNAELTINRSDLNVLDSVVAKNIGVVDGIVEVKAEIFPMGLIVTFDEAQAEQWQRESEIAKENGWNWYTYSMSTVYAFLKIEMKDGTIYNQYYDLTSEVATWVDLENDEVGVKHIRYTFDVPLDISQIAKITYCGAELEF